MTDYGITNGIFHYGTAAIVRVDAVTAVHAWNYPDPACTIYHGPVTEERPPAAFFRCDSPEERDAIMRLLRAAMEGAAQ
jgi:hypothetical protein